MTAKMETTFYDDALNASFLQSESGAYGYSNPKILKQSMTLNLADPVGSLKPHLRAKNSDLLTSPDVGLLKLASPELERLIIQSSNGHITTTPTPTQFLCPKNVTDEQEGFAEGFVRALAELHSQNTLPSVTSAAQPVSGAGMVAPAVASVAGGSGSGGFSASLHSEPPVYANLSNFNPGALSSGGGAPSYGAAGLAFPAQPQQQQQPPQPPHHLPQSSGWIRAQSCTECGWSSRAGAEVRGLRQTDRQTQPASTAAESELHIFIFFSIVSPTAQS